VSLLLNDLFGADRQVLALAVARAAESVGNSFLIVVLPLFIASDAVGGASFGLTEVALTGIVLSLFGFVNSPLQPFTGRFSDRIGRRKILVLFGLAVLAVASFSYSLATAYWQLIVLRILQGVAGAFIIPTTIALVNDLAAEDNRGGNMGTYNTFRLVGFGAGPVAAGGVVAAGPYSLAAGPLALSLTGFEAAFTLAGGTALVSSLLVLFTVREPDIEPVDPESDSGSIRIFDQDGDRLLDPVFTLGVVAFFMAVGIALFATLGELVNERLGQGSQMFGLQFAAFIFAQVLFQAPIGRATDFYGRKPFIVAGTALLIPTTLVQGFVLDSWLMFFARFAQGVAGAMVFAPGLALAGDLASGSGSGTTLSVLTMAFSLGVAVGPLLSGFLVAYGFYVPFTFGALLALVGLVLVQTQVDDVLSLADSDPVASSDPGD
jgi:MFS family permease